MTHSIRFPLVALAWLAPAIAAFADPPKAAQPAAPTKTVADWTRQLSDPDPANRVQAAEALGALGPAAQAAAPALGKVVRAEPLYSRMRETAERALQELASDPGKARPELVRTLAEILADESLSRGNGAMHHWAASALRQIPMDVRAPVVDRFLRETDAFSRFRLMPVIARWGPAGRDVLPALLEELAAEGGTGRDEAVPLAGDLGPAGAAAVPRLRALLAEESCRFNAAHSLARIGRFDLALPVLAEMLEAGELGGVESALAEIGAPAVPVLTAALRSKKPSVRHDAAAGLGVIGPDAAPAVAALTALLADADPRVRGSAAWALGEIGLEARPAVPAMVNLLRDDDWDLQRTVVDALGRIGGPAAVKGLTRAVADDERGECYGPFTLTNSLVRLGPAAAPALPILAARLPNGRSRRPPAWFATPAGQAVGGIVTLFLRRAETALIRARTAFDGLSAIGPAALPALTKAAGDPDPTARIEALYAIGRMGADAAPAVPTLVAGLADAEMEVRRAAANALGSVGPAAAPAAPALARLIRTDSDVAVSAGHALRAIGPAGAAAVPELIRGLEAEDKSFRFVCHDAGLLAVAGMGPAAAPAVPTLRRLLEEGAWNVPEGARAALGAIGPAAREALPQLQAFLETPGVETDDPEGSIVAAEAYLRIDPAGPAARRAMAVLTAPLFLRRPDGDADPRADAVIHALDRLGPAARPALPDLIAVLPRLRRVISELPVFPEEECPTETVVIRILARFGPAAREAAPVLRRFMDYHLPQVRATAAAGLWRITGERNEPAAVLREVFAPRHLHEYWKVPWHRRAAVEGMADMGRADFLPYLLDALRNRDAVLRRMAAEALGKSGPAAASAVPALAVRLDDPDYPVRRAAAEALGRIGPAARSAMPALLTALRDPDPRLSRAAAGAVAEMLRRW